MKLLPLLLLVPSIAYAGSWFQFEAGAGVSLASDVDGVWTQHNVADNHERVKTPAFVAGLTGELYAAHNWSFNYHADYTYLGTQTATCNCVSDADYAARNYGGTAYRFDGSGHVQGIALTLEPGYTYRGTRFAIEGGPFLFWTTWKEAAYLDPTQHVRTPSGMRVGYVMGARIERGNLSLSYRYYTHILNSTDQYPGLVRNLQTLTAVYRF
jgi:hypothetical protein